jgi:hypothetical protein
VPVLALGLVFLVLLIATARGWERLINKLIGYGRKKP